jgi:hypothetical protein
MILASTLFIFLFSNGGIYIQDQWLGGGEFSAGALIGPVPVGELSRAKAMEKVDQSISQWQQHAKVVLNYKGQDILLTSSIFKFDKENSVKQAASSGSSPLLVTVSEQSLQEQMKSVLTQIPSSLDWNLLIKDAETKVSSLTRSIRVNMDGFVKLPSEEKIVGQAELSLPFDMPVLQEWTKTLNDIEIKPGDKFSLLSLMNSKNLDPKESNDLQFMASAIFRASLNTDMAILERHISQSKPDFIPLGYEADVIPGKWDLVLENSAETAYRMDLIYRPKTIQVLIKGVPPKDTYSVEFSDPKEYTPRTIIQWNSALNLGERVEKEVGQAGASVKIYRVIKKADGKTRKDLISEDFYFPRFRIVEENPNSPTQNNGLNADLSTQDPTSVPGFTRDQTNTGSNEGEKNTQKPVNDNPSNATPAKRPSVPVHVIGKPI